MDLPITGVTLRAQDVQPGDLFAALPGGATHGAGFFRDASGILHRRMFPLARHVDGVRPERSFMNKGRALLSQLYRSFGELGIEAIGHGLSRTRWPKHDVRSNHAAVRQRNVFAVL